MTRLQGKVAFITGAGSGIGRATALLFAHEGASVAVAGIPEASINNTCHDITRAGGRAIPVLVDVTSAAAVEAAVQATLEHLGRLDIVFNNAGIGLVDPIETTSIETWDTSIAVNLTGVFLGCKYAIPAMRRQGQGGSIINSASTAALTGLPGRAAYAASKGGVIAMTRVLAIECAPDAIRVNSISPGATRTEMVQRLYEETDDPQAASLEHARRQPIGRLSLPEEIAQGVLYLASDDSRTVTGINLVVDGGFSVPR